MYQLLISQRQLALPSDWLCVCVYLHLQDPSNSGELHDTVVSTLRETVLTEKGGVDQVQVILDTFMLSVF